MSLQDIFYIVAIVFMILYIGLFIGLIILLVYIKQKITDFSQTMEKQVAIVKAITSHPEEIAASISAAVVEKLITKLKRSVPFFH